MQKSRCTVLSGWMGDANRFVRPVNVFPLVETIHHCWGWLRQGLVAYYRLPMPQVFRSSNPGLARAVAITSCILMATHVSAAAARTPNAVVQIRSLLRAQQDAWNRGDIDGFMNDTRAQYQLFLSRKIPSVADGKLCGRGTARNILIARRWEHSVFRTLRSICCPLMRLSCWVAGDWHGQRIARMAASRSFLDACQGAGELCTIIRRRRRRDHL